MLQVEAFANAWIGQEHERIIYSIWITIKTMRDWEYSTSLNQNTIAIWFSYSVMFYFYHAASSIWITFLSISKELASGNFCLFSFRFSFFYSSSPSGDLLKMLDTDCRLRQIGHHLNTYYVSFAMRKGHPMFQALATGMQRMIEEGTVDDIIQEYPQLTGWCKANEKNHKEAHQSLSFMELRGLFLVIGIMLFIAFCKAVIWKKRYPVSSASRKL